MAVTSLSWLIAYHFLGYTLSNQKTAGSSTLLPVSDFSNASPLNAFSFESSSRGARELLPLAEHHRPPARLRSCCAGPAGCGSVAGRPSLWLLNNCCHFSPTSGANSHSDFVWYVGLRHQRETTVSEPWQKSRRQGLIDYIHLSLL